ncbi:MAG: hydantoinase B/oxoprolinase family protein, partial [Pseudonocardia sp.]|nr:hydantoinase B/oxoprolinase family protein [Pseudonocardia sp.]
MDPPSSRRTPPPPCSTRVTSSKSTRSAACCSRSRCDMTEEATSRRPTDLVTEEIIRAGLVAITDEMKTNLMRTAYNLIIYEAQDFTVGLFDAEGN